MQLDNARIRFASMTGSRSALNDRIVEVRKLLRTNLYLTEIAERLGVSYTALAAFIKRRNICDVKERRQFIGRLRLDPSRLEESAS